MRPRMEFYKFLAKKPNLKQRTKTHERKLKLWIPDTIVSNDSGMQPYWIYTGSDGVVRKTEEFNDKDIVVKMANQLKLDELICIAKTVAGESAYGVKRAGVELLNPRDLTTRMNTFLGGGDITVL